MLMLFVLLTGGALATPARAADAPSGVPVRDSVAAPAVPAPAVAAPDTAGRAAALARRRANAFGEQPRAVMFRSLLVPGWGQLHNHAWIKAAGVAGSETWLITSLLHDRTLLDRDRAAANAAAAIHDEAAYTVAVNRYNSRLDSYVGGQWLLGGLLAYALVDAYVDAHFRRFEIEFRTDPALPREITPEDGRGGTPPAESRGRLSLRWTF